MLRRSVCVSLAAVAALAQPTTAVPPTVVRGVGQITWGLWITPPSTPPYPAQGLSFTGSATMLPSLVVAACSFTGSGATTGANVLSGTMSGTCGGTSYPSCTFVLTQASWTFTCGAAVGSFALRPANVNPTTVLAADGTIG